MYDFTVIKDSFLWDAIKGLGPIFVAYVAYIVSKETKDATETQAIIAENQYKMNLFDKRFDFFKKFSNKYDILANFYEDDQDKRDYISEIFKIIIECNLIFDSENQDPILKFNRNYHKLARCEINLNDQEKKKEKLLSNQEDMCDLLKKNLPQNENLSKTKEELERKIDEMKGKIIIKENEMSKILNDLCKNIDDIYRLYKEKLILPPDPTKRI